VKFNTSLEPIYVCGPTASGKSALAIQLAKEYHGEVINADAFQLYHGLNIITAMPSDEEQSIVPHHLFGILSPKETCDAQHYLDVALPIICSIQQRGKTPIIVGGSGLYLKFLTHGPSPLPPSDPKLRERLDKFSLDELIKQLQSLDPKEVTQVSLQNRRYVSRSLEICLLSGKKVSELRDSWLTANTNLSSSLRGYLISLSRKVLHQRILERTKKMLESGAIDEIRNQSNLSTTAVKAIGISQIRSLLLDEIDYATCLEQIIVATRQYAKRQETWFRKEAWLTNISANELAFYHQI
jgi:tRNA dimethylallyltransferase